MKIFKHLRGLKNNLRGDTIVEVLISIAILTVVLGTAYAISSHSLQTGTASTQRDQALGYAQRQVEFIKTLQAAAGVTGTNVYTQLNYPFCILGDGTTAKGTDLPCQHYDGSPNGNSTSSYRVAIEYNSSSFLFKVTITWAAANSDSQPGQLQLFYKLAGGYALPPGARTDAATDITSANATLNGAVQPNNASTTFHFEYGTTTGYGTTTTESAAISGGASFITVTGSTVGVSASTTYHFRICATSAAGSSCGQDMSFTTPASGGGGGGGGGGSCAGTRIRSPDAGYAGPNVCIHTFSGGTNVVTIYVDHASCSFSPGGISSNPCPGASTNGSSVTVGASPNSYTLTATGGGNEQVQISTTVNSGGGSCQYGGTYPNCNPPPPPPPPPNPGVQKQGCAISTPGGSALSTSPCPSPCYVQSSCNPITYCYNTSTGAVKWPPYSSCW